MRSLHEPQIEEKTLYFAFGQDRIAGQQNAQSRKVPCAGISTPVV